MAEILEGRISKSVTVEKQGTSRKEAKMVSRFARATSWRKDSKFPFKHLELVWTAFISALWNKPGLLGPSFQDSVETLSDILKCQSDYTIPEMVCWFPWKGKHLRDKINAVRMRKVGQKILKPKTPILSTWCRGREKPLQDGHGSSAPELLGILLPDPLSVHAFFLKSFVFFFLNQ